MGGDTALVLCQHGSPRIPRACSSRRSHGDPLYLGRAVTTGPHTRRRSLSWGVWTCAAVVRYDNPALQERLPHCGTACHGVRHARPRFTSCTASCWSLPTTTTLRPAHVGPGRHACPPAARCSRGHRGRGGVVRHPRHVLQPRAGQTPRKVLWYFWMTRKSRRIACFNRCSRTIIWHTSSVCPTPLSPAEHSSPWSVRSS